MKEKTITFATLQEQVLRQLQDNGYMDSTLTIYRRFYNRVHAFLKKNDTEVYTKEAGAEFLANLSVADSTLPAYACAIRRLDDYTEGRPYRCHHDNPSEKVAEVYAQILENYLDSCRDSGNKPATVKTKEKTCISFLNYLEQNGCTDLSELEPGLITKALLIYSNRDNYARIRSFLKYLADEGITGSDYSIIVPHYKRRKGLPTAYTPEEISCVESSVDTSTDTGIRNLAIIRLASRMGLRSGDIAKLKWSEIDFNTECISIIQEKTGQPLSLQMPHEVTESLLMHLENTKDSSEDGYVFHSMSAPYSRITTNIIRHAVNDSFTAAGIDTSGKKHGPHALRSSLASSMVNDGGSYETVRRILGHSDPDVIKHYARIDIENLRRCSIDPPAPTGLFSDYLSGKKVISNV